MRRMTPREMTYDDLVAHAERLEVKLAQAHNKIGRLRSAIKALERAVAYRNAALMSGLGVHLTFTQRVAR